MADVSVSPPPRTVRAWRKARAITQVELAARVRCQQSTMSDIESAKLLPNILLAMRIADAFGVTVYEIAWGNDEGRHTRKARDT